jgi:hypothetical protein
MSLISPLNSNDRSIPLIEQFHEKVKWGTLPWLRKNKINIKIIGVLCLALKEQNKYYNFWGTMSWLRKNKINIKNFWVLCPGLEERTK